MLKSALSGKRFSGLNKVLQNDELHGKMNVKSGKIKKLKIRM